MNQNRSTIWQFSTEEVITALREFMLKRGVPAEATGRFYLEVLPRGPVAAVVKWETTNAIGQPESAPSVAGGIPANGLTSGSETITANPTG